MTGSRKAILSKSAPETLNNKIRKILLLYSRDASAYLNIAWVDYCSAESKLFMEFTEMNTA